MERDWHHLHSPAANPPAVQFFRQLLEPAAPGAVLITETNVPHQDNVAYFGDGYNEAQLVYNFALPPLTLHALQTGDGQRADPMGIPFAARLRRQS